MRRSRCDVGALNLEAHARRLCTEHNLVDADVDTVINRARTSLSEREKLFDMARRYPAPPVHRERRR